MRVAVLPQKTAISSQIVAKRRRRQSNTPSFQLLGSLFGEKSASDFRLFFTFWSNFS
jgi:hypothetical protein